MQLTIEEAGQQLAEKSERVQSIRAKQAEMQTIALGVGRAAARNEAALAEAVLAGGDVAEVLQANAPAGIWSAARGIEQHQSECRL